MGRSPSQPPDRRAVLGDAVRDRMLLWISCAACGNRRRMDPAELARRLGYDFAVPDLAWRMRCSRCGGRDIQVRLERPGDGPVTRHG